MTTSTGKPYIVCISYKNPITHARSVPNCPLRLLGRPGLKYSVEFFKALAEKVRPGLKYLGLLHDGTSLDYLKAVPSGGIDVVDDRVY